ncbi:GMP/IMP nucleotidase [Candidatus Methylospira mobilis]|uniref:GMP/IMP nucleotidase n=1 Tax=Candidatus Methylospira mobilis TaxID=1808979 RepID=A0A5Q0BL93_9GAMM|nr:GMP/IMP nucleotidase [Candidatus Methylospira mobilis]QFY42536.1 GMP/IMP nucleotidase [Candidatus Methylospira mobilis]WNV04355.1 GMP/IMP nucleotidase [Candidatus Methylospira mobilis]
MINWNQIDSVFLDMDGTLLDLNFDNQFWKKRLPQRYAERHGLDFESALEVLRPRFKELEGQLEWYCLDYWSEQLAVDVPALKRELAELIEVLPYVVDFLSAVKAQKKRLVLVTNAHPKSFELKMEKTKLRHWFDQIVIAHELGLPKENPQFWERLNTMEPFQPERALMVDDSLSVLRSARHAGIHTLAISLHDTQQPARIITEFPAIRDFREIMPDLTN